MRQHPEILTPLVGAYANPQVSVGMPVYNGAQFIRGALDSLLSQTFTNFELIISDNASTDETEKICRDYAAKDTRIRYIRQNTNVGPGANFKFVLDEAVGEYFIWAAHDDRRSANAIERMMEVMEADKSVGLVFSDVITKDLITGSEVRSSTGYSASKSKKVNYLHRLVNVSPVMLYGLHRKSVLRKFSFATYDFMDVHLTHWYELNSTVKVVPLYLYVCGKCGIRKPRSLTGSKITFRTFLKQEWTELNVHFAFYFAALLFLVSAFRIYVNTRSLNRLVADDASK